MNQGQKIIIIIIIMMIIIPHAFNKNHSDPVFFKSFSAVFIADSSPTDVCRLVTGLAEDTLGIQLQCLKFLAAKLHVFKDGLLQFPYNWVVNFYNLVVFHPITWYYSIISIINKGFSQLLQCFLEWLLRTRERLVYFLRDDGPERLGFTFWKVKQPPGMRGLRDDYP